MDAFFERLDDARFRATAMTRGPWSIDHQHAGPPSALLGSQLAAQLGAGRIVRCTFEILQPVPITDLTVEVEVLRPGRNVTLGQATLSGPDGPVMLARAWRLRELAVDLPADGAIGTDTTMRGIDDAERQPFFSVEWDEGYHVAMEIRFVEGSFAEHGDAKAWLRSTIDLIDDEPITPLQRLLVAADTGNGISSRLPIREWLFVNTDLTVHVRDLPRGPWVGLDATTRFGPDGIGLATATIHAEQGPIGTAIQSLVVQPQRG
jgi:hypothetical protein